MVCADIRQVRPCRNHVRQISYLNNELFERLVPLLAWYYLQEGAEPGTYSN